jgi:aldehyde:ferredoxin oxidoreductase
MIYLMIGIKNIWEVGVGIGLRILLKELKGNEDPISSDNILVFATGPLQGTGIAGAG